MFVIRRKSDSRFVAQAGSKSSYTDYLQTARRFATREQAQAECCDNEYVTSVDECFKGGTNEHYLFREKIQIRARKVDQLKNK